MTVEQFKEFYKERFNRMPKVFSLNKKDFDKLEKITNEPQFNYWYDALVTLKEECELKGTITKEDLKDFKNTGVIYIALCPRQETISLTYEWDKYNKTYDPFLNTRSWHNISNKELYYLYKLISFFEPLK